jgi:2'-5' RNA ligase
MPRLFIAIDLPDPIMEQLARISFGLPGVRWTPPEQLHLTLRFIGEVDGTLFHDIREELSRVEAPAMTMQLEGMGHFPPRKAPRVLWVGITSRSREALQILRNRVDTRLSQAGIAPEGRKFAPHITIGRIKNCPVSRLTKFLQGHALFETQPFQIERFHLYSSALTSKGAIHNIEASYNLN